MRGVQLYIGTGLADVGADTNLLLTFSLENISKPAERRAPRSTTVKLPWTDANHSLLNYLNDVQARNVEVGTVTTFSPTKLRSGKFEFNKRTTASIVIGGITVFEGNCHLLRLVRNKHYEVALVGVAQDWVNRMGDSLLATAPAFTGLTDTYSVAAIETNLAALSSGTIDSLYHSWAYYNCSDTGAAPVSIKSWQGYKNMPQLFVRKAVEAAFGIAGYTVTRNFFDTPERKGRTLLCENLVNGRWQDRISGPEVLLASHVIPEAAYIGDFQLVQSLRGFGPGDKIRIHIDANWYANALGWTVNPSIRVYFNGYTPRMLGSPTDLEVSTTPSFALSTDPTNAVGALDYTVTLPDTREVLGMFLVFEGTPNYGIPGPPLGFPKYSATVEVYGTQRRVTDGVVYNIGALAGPELKAVEFIAALQKEHNLFIIPNEKAKTVEIYSHDEFYSRALPWLDTEVWDNKFAADKETREEFLSTLYDRRTLFSYSEDDTIAGKAFKDSTGYTFGYHISTNPNENSPDTTNEVTSNAVSSTHVTATNTAGAIQNMSVGLTSVAADVVSEIDNAHKALRFGQVFFYPTLSIEKNTLGYPFQFSGEVIATISNYDPLVTRTGVPVVLFYIPTGHVDTVYDSEGLTFGPEGDSEGLYALYYQAQFNLLYKTRTLEAYFYLTAKDIEGLNFRKPIRIANQQYRLQEVKEYDCKVEKLTRATLLQL